MGIGLWGRNIIAERLRVESEVRRFIWEDADADVDTVAEVELEISD